MRTRIKVIANPVSGRGHAARLAAMVLYRLQLRGCHLEFHPTQKSGDARRFAEHLLGYSAIACVGGDGTVNEVINGLPDGPSPPLGIIPSGTANVLAKELKLPWVVDAITDVLLDGREIDWDLGINRTTGRKFALFAGAGFDSYVVEEFHRNRKGPIHILQYIFWGLRAIPVYNAPRLTVEVDGKLLETEAAWVEVSNVASYGGPLVFTPEAKPDDGLFEIMIQKGRRRRDTLRIFFAALVSYLFDAPYRMNDVYCVKGRRVRITSADGKRVPLHLDGDPAGELPADLEILPSAVRVLAPVPLPARVE